MNIRVPIAAFAVSLFMAGAAFAQNAYTTGNVNMRSGPGTSYPRVTVIPNGAGVDVLGCTTGWRWCDTQWRGIRGWVSASYLQLMYQGRRVQAPEYLPRYGLPIITFEFGNYWDRHYRGSSWYRDRDYWDRWGNNHRPPSRPTRPTPSVPPISGPDRPRPPEVIRPTPSRPPVYRPDRPRPPEVVRPTPSRPPEYRPDRPRPPEVIRPQPSRPPMAGSDRPRPPEVTRPQPSRPQESRPSRPRGDDMRPSRPSREGVQRGNDNRRGDPRQCTDAQGRPARCL